MDSKYRNRVLGMIILVALAIIILPILLDGKKEHYKNDFVTIPIMPASPTLSQDELQSIDELPDDGEQMLAAQDTLDKVATADQKTDLPVQNKPTKPPTTEQPDELKQSAAISEEPKKSNKPTAKATQNTLSAGNAYVIQLGALKNSIKVEQIVANLRLNGYTVYTVPSTPVSGKVTRIYVGPDLSKDKLQSMLEDLKKLSQLEGKVVNFSP